MRNRQPLVIGIFAGVSPLSLRIGSPKDIPAAIRFGKSIRGVKGLVVVVKDKMGAWGDLELVPTG